jgi:hypothetical protein
MTAQTVGGDLFDGRQRTASALWPLVPVGVAVFALSALVFYHLHQDGQPAETILQSVIVSLYRGLGFMPAFMFFLLVLTWGSIWFLTGKLERPWARLGCLCSFALALAIWMNLRSDSLAASPYTGHIGDWVASRMVGVLGYVFSTLLVGLVAIAAFWLATDGFFYRYIDEAWLQQGHSDALEREHGVEPAASEHLKSLAGSTTARTTSVTPVEEAAAVTAAFAELQRAMEPLDAAAPPSRLHAPDAALAPQRRSWRERQQDSPDDAATAPAIEASALPPAPEIEVEAAAEARSEAEAAVVEPEPVETEPDSSEPVETGSVESGFEAVGDRARELDDDRATQAELPWSGASTGGIEHAIEDADEDDNVPPSRRPLAPLAEADDEAAPVDEVAEPLERAEALDLGETEVVIRAAEPEAEPTPPVAEPAAAPEPIVSVDAAPPIARGERADDDERDSAMPSDEPLVDIPRPPEGRRQRRLFQEPSMDQALVRDAIELVTSSRRASAAYLQRKLRIEFSQAMDLLLLLARRGVIEIGEGETQGRVLQ